MKIKSTRAFEYKLYGNPTTTHKKDSTAHNVGFRYAVITPKGVTLAYYFDYTKAQQHAKHSGARVVYLTGGNKTLVANPVKDFNPPENYNKPQTTLDRVRASFSPGIRRVKNLASSPIIPGTDWPVPDNIDIPLKPGMSLYPHQTAAIIEMARRGNVLLGDEQGLGKTIEIAGYMNLLEPTHTVIVAPMAAMRNWVRELNKWLVKPHRIVVLEGKDFFLTKMYGRKIVLQKLPDQEKFEWDIVISSFSSFTSRGGSKVKANLTAEDEREFDTGSKYTVRRGSENLGYFKTEDEALMFAQRNGAGAFEIKKSRKGKFSLVTVVAVKRITPQVRRLCRILETPGLDLLVLDEMHYLKNIDSKRAQAFFGEPDDPETGERGYYGLAYAAKKKIYASGTPLVNDKPIELFYFLNSLDKKNFISEGLFTEYFGGKRGRKKRGAEDEDSKNLNILGVKMRDTVLIRRLVADVLVLPNMRVKGLELAETPEIIHARELEEEAIKELEDSGIDYSAAIIKSFEDPNAANLAEQEMEEAIDALLDDPDVSDEEKAETVSLAQGAWDAKRQKLGRRVKIDFSKISEARRVMGHAKALRTRYMIDKIKDELGDRIVNGKIVIFFHHKVVASTLVKELKKAGYEEDQIVTITGGSSIEERDEAVEAFQNDKNVKIFLGSITSAGAAITLTAANVMLFVEQDWRPGFVQQCMKRIYRIGQTADVVYEFFSYAKQSIDSNMFEVLLRKEGVQKTILDTPPDENVVNKYESDFKEPDLPGCRYQIDQRYAITTAVRQILNHLEGDNGVINYDNAGLSRNDVYTMQYLLDESKKKDSWEYGYKPALRSDRFPERYFDDVLPLVWKKRTLANPTAIRQITFPDSITGIQRGLFNAVREYDASIPAFVYLKAATHPVRQEIMIERRDHNRAVRGGGKKREDPSQTDIQELAEIARRMANGEAE